MHKKGDRHIYRSIAQNETSNDYDADNDCDISDENDAVADGRCNTDIVDDNLFKWQTIHIKLCMHF